MLAEEDRLIGPVDPGQPLRGLLDVAKNGLRELVANLVLGLLLVVPRPPGEDLLEVRNDFVEAAVLIFSVVRRTRSVSLTRAAGLFSPGTAWSSGPHNAE
ncbi:hypothetical protein KI372_06905 [Halobacterium salinarum]|nr:hypothetical protein [Halobacterium salinarum]MCF2208006.1 hypothetical protein [Halobacterium salinarum]MCF2241110.1 hypothetical protein [Halobacterium salinarum]